MNPTSIFKDIADFRKYCDGLQADTEYRQLLPSIRSTAAAISGIIGGRTLLAISELEEGNEGLEALKTAIATGTLYRYQIFDSVKKNGSDASMYKYQHEEIKEHHISAHWLAMDTLLDWLDANHQTGGYDQTRTYRERQELPVKNAEEFNYYYGIDRSAYFFSKVQFLIRQIWVHKLKPMISGLEINEDIAAVLGNEVAVAAVSVGIGVRAVGLAATEEDRGTALVALELNYGKVDAAKTADRVNDIADTRVFERLCDDGILGNIALADLERGYGINARLRAADRVVKLLEGSRGDDFLSFGVLLVAEGLEKEVRNRVVGRFRRAAADSDHVFVVNPVFPVVVGKTLGKRDRFVSVGLTDEDLELVALELLGRLLEVCDHIAGEAVNTLDASREKLKCLDLELVGNVGTDELIVGGYAEAYGLCLGSLRGDIYARRCLLRSNVAAGCGSENEYREEQEGDQTEKSVLHFM